MRRASSLSPTRCSVHVKVDEDLPLAAAEALRASGYHASTVVGQSMGGWKDPPLWETDGIDPVVLLLERVLAHFDLRELEGTLAVATPGGLRIRRTDGRLRQDFER